jgi:hypothetical protein
MKKGYSLIFLLFSLILISSCSEIETGKTNYDNLQGQENSKKTTDHIMANDFRNLERNIDVLIEAGNLIGSQHYDNLESEVIKLENEGQEISILRQKLSKLMVAGREKSQEGDNFGVINNSSKHINVQKETNLENQTSKLNDKLPQKYRKNVEFPTDEERELLPECGDKYFTTNPVDLKDVSSITPLGNIGPPGHTFPTDHSFLHLGKYETNYAYQLYAPADVHITMISWGKGFTQDPIDYTIYFALCKDVIGYYNHVKALSENIEAITDKIDCEDFGTQAENSCTKILLEEVSEGTLLGEVGYKQGNFDFGLMDLRKELDFVSPERHPTRTKYIQCPYEYYREDLQKQFFDLINREGTQKCGLTMQDVPGTLKGAWFHENAEEEYGVDWDLYLAFVNDNDFPEVQIVSIAGIFTEPSKFKFEPKNSGYVNREFSQVKSDGKIYCYEGSNIGKSFENVPSGKIIVQMISDSRLNIEHRTGICTGSESFKDFEIYNR